MSAWNPITEVAIRVTVVMWRVGQGRHVLAWATGRRGRAIAQALADIATIAIVQHNTAIEARVVNEQLTVALNSRIVIEQAKGVVAERDRVDVVQAFELIRSHARTNSRRLAEVATEIVDGTLRL